MPNHDIPQPFKWDDTFKVFYYSLDEEHQGLFDGVFACAEARDSKEKLSSLYEKVKTHLTNEEERMTEKNYSNLTSHKDLHAAFLKELEALSVPLPDDKVVYAKERVVNHIKDIDFSYKGKLD